MTDETKSGDQPSDFLASEDADRKERPGELFDRDNPEHRARARDDVAMLRRKLPENVVQFDSNEAFQEWIKQFEVTLRPEVAAQMDAAGPGKFWVDEDEYIMYPFPRTVGHE
jgi:hypothetical protein